jgi:hypothetical protein
MIYLRFIGPLRSVPQLPRSAMLIVRHLARGYMLRPNRGDADSSMHVVVNNSSSSIVELWYHQILQLP